MYCVRKVSIAHTLFGTTDLSAPSSATSIDRAKYIASPIEREWLRAPKAGKICQTGLSQAAQTTIWTNYSYAVFHPHSRPYAPMTIEEHNSLSHIWTNGRMQPIEPLSGVGRHPSFCQGNIDHRFLFDITYILPQNECTEVGHPIYPSQKSIYFDIGCTMFGSMGKVPASGKGPSIPLFIQVYAERCVNFDEVYGWEGTEYTAATWWKDVPAAWRAKVHFYNVFVREESYEDTRASGYTAEKSEASFLKMLPYAAKEEDLVVLKLDADNGPELQIAETIANRPDLYKLIDEMYFEYHYWYDDLEFGWSQTINDNEMPRSRTSFNVDIALELFNKLRRVGVRVHFWI